MRIYADNAATTPVDPLVVEAMMPYLTERFGNASSVHMFGQEARAGVEKARGEVAALIGAAPGEVVFTSGGTESNNLAIRGFVEANSGGGRHIVTSGIEHAAVRDVCSDLSGRGFEVTEVPCGADGTVSAEEVLRALRDDTVLVSLMLANNETGVIQPVSEVGTAVAGLRRAGRRIALHTDAVQAAGRIPVSVEELGCDLLSLSSHKLYAPKGTGALYVRKGTRLSTQNIGGGQERKLRGGTENVAGIAAFGSACAIALGRLEEEPSKLRRMLDIFELSVGDSIPGATFNGNRGDRLPNISNISFEGAAGEAVLINLDMRGAAVSTGSACSSGTIEPSPVIRALGGDPDRARCAVRFSFGRFNSEEDVRRLAESLAEVVALVRSL